MACLHFSKMVCHHLKKKGVDHQAAADILGPRHHGVDRLHRDHSGLGGNSQGVPVAEPLILLPVI